MRAVRWARCTAGRVSRWCSNNDRKDSSRKRSGHSDIVLQSRVDCIQFLGVVLVSEIEEIGYGRDDSTGKLALVVDVKPVVISLRKVQGIPEQIFATTPDVCSKRLAQNWN